MSGVTVQWCSVLQSSDVWYYSPVMFGVAVQWCLVLQSSDVQCCSPVMSGVAAQWCSVLQSSDVWCYSPVMSGVAVQWCLVLQSGDVRYCSPVMFGVTVQWCSVLLSVDVWCYNMVMFGAAVQWCLVLQSSDVWCYQSAKEVTKYTWNLFKKGKCATKRTEDGTGKHVSKVSLGFMEKAFQRLSSGTFRAQCSVLKKYAILGSFLHDATNQTVNVFSTECRCKG